MSESKELCNLKLQLKRNCLFIIACRVFFLACENEPVKFENKLVMKYSRSKLSPIKFQLHFCHPWALKHKCIGGTVDKDNFKYNIAFRYILFSIFCLPTNIEKYISLFINAKNFNLHISFIAVRVCLLRVNFSNVCNFHADPQKLFKSDIFSQF